ncbi:MAG: hypothetical protein ACI4UL_01995 [Muribaculaceae bacterium]
MKKKVFRKILLLIVCVSSSALNAQASLPSDSVAASTPTSAVKKSRLTLGGYGEAVMTANFFSQHFNRYKQPARYADDRYHGRFDLPHVCINLGYDFGHGWTLGSEIEFEHGGAGTAVEIEAEESGEYEAETEKGGEVNIEQVWINKSFASGRFNIRAGEIIVPVGYTNAYHEPMNFFTCYRPEGENTILPCTWHQVGVSLWGKVGDWRYEAQLLSGLNSESFTAEDFVHYGATSPYEFKVANTLAGAARIDNYSIPGLRIGVSGYYGHTFSNTLKYAGDSYAGVKGALSIVSLDFALKRWNWIVRGNALYAHLGDADAISAYNKANSTHHKYQDGNPYHDTNIASSAVSYGIEAGYNIFSQIRRLSGSRHRFYLFGRYEYYNSMASGTYKSQYKYTEKHRYAFGFNYQPLNEIVIKGEFSKRLFNNPDNNGLAPDSPLYVHPYNSEPSISISIAYCGWFL